MKRCQNLWSKRHGGIAMIYGYARVSTVEQSLNGNSLGGQVEQLKKKVAKLLYKSSSLALLHQDLNLKN